MIQEYDNTLEDLKHRLWYTELHILFIAFRKYSDKHYFTIGHNMFKGPDSYESMFKCQFSYEFIGHFYQVSNTFHFAIFIISNVIFFNKDCI